MLQLPLTPGRETEWLVHTGDVVSGYVVRAEDVVSASTPAQLFETHGLGFPGTPFSPAMPFIDVVRFQETAGMNLVTPFGRPSDVEVAEPAGPFVDHPPFRGLGFTSGGDQVAPLWWLDPFRLPPGSEIWRVQADGRQHPLAVYPDVARGWVPVQGFPVDQDHAFPPSDLLGTFGTWRGARLLVDLLPDGMAVVGSAAEIPDAGLTRTPRGVWTTTVPVGELSDVVTVRLTATWRGLPFQVLSRSYQGDRLVARLVYIGRNALEAEAAGLQKMDAGLYQAFAPMDELTDVGGVETQPLAAPAG